MRVLVDVILCFLLNAFYLPSARIAEAIGSFGIEQEEGRLALLLILNCYFVIDVLISIFCRKKKVLTDTFDGEDLTGSDKQVASLKSELKSSKAELLSIIEKYRNAKADAESLRTALQDAQKKLSKAGTGKPDKRPEWIDTELVNLLSTLQEKGRFIDFVMNDVTPYSDEQVGAAARAVHQGCSTVIRDYFHVTPVCSEEEGGPVTVPNDCSAKEYRLAGKVIGEPPFQGTLLHRGWKTDKVTLPRVVHSKEDSEKERIIAPAEVEI